MRGQQNLKFPNLNLHVTKKCLEMKQLENELNLLSNFYFFSYIVVAVIMSSFKGLCLSN